MRRNRGRRLRAATRKALPMTRLLRGAATLADPLSTPKGRPATRLGGGPVHARRGCELLSPPPCFEFAMETIEFVDRRFGDPLVCNALATMSDGLMMVAAWGGSDVVCERSTRDIGGGGSGFGDY
jgi:hypothetical protein